MNIVYTTNDLFCAKVGASICSIFENNKSADDITIFIIGQSLSTKNIKNFSILASEYHRKIEIIPLDNLNKFIPFTFDTSGWNPIVLARLILDHLLPESIDRILYIDGDTVILRSLSALWNTDLKGNVLGGFFFAFYFFFIRKVLTTSTISCIVYFVDKTYRIS